MHGARRVRHALQRRLAGLRAACTRPRAAVPEGQFAFRCNICGAHGHAAAALLRDREAPTCSVCRSNQRFRALMAALQARLLGEVGPLRLQRPRKELTGLGMSDAGLYADWLEAKFDYTNTFFHAEPFLDIQRPDPRYEGRCDFLVTSDVLEHVLPPIASAFANLHALLKPGGVLAMTVPYGLQAGTREHFPELHAFRIQGEGARRHLVNRTRDGREQVFHDLLFHGGDGATLEMRVFALADLVDLLRGAGFIDIRVHDAALAEWGIFPDGPCSHPITAIAGAVKPASTAAMR
ncbi:MAG: methyltransferase domain-containing protein [Lysobacter sp.]|nr:methyltransferase domain-containing protein [Lysobacter sp.]